jgi:hypothetical protein
MGASNEDFWGQGLDQDRQSSLDNFSIELKLYSSSISQCLEILKANLLSINTNNQILYLHLPYLVGIGFTKFCDAVGFNQTSDFDTLKGIFAIGRRSKQRQTLLIV